MERFFPADRIIISGNPIRKEIVPPTPQMKEEGYKFYGLDPEKKHLFIVGGSLGSGTLNKSVRKWIQEGKPGGENLEIIWQCGKIYKKDVDAFMAEMEAKQEGSTKDIWYSDFIQRMDLAYAVADVVVSRSGASSVSELCAANKATIFVPSPNVAEDHQTHNAMALVRKDAALIVKDCEAESRLIPLALKTVTDTPLLDSLGKNALSMAFADSDQKIAQEVLQLIVNK
jgi:UDP-N-acetylglucosamine--N-acetylmuramyl-(pentapeptide) pyrophosphoryl-undecaprenol N-acetylglucosamine transferase